MDRAWSVVALVAVAAGAGLLVSASDRISRQRIVANQMRQLLDTLHQVIDPALYDNDLLASRRSLINPALQPDGEADAYFATRNGQPLAVLLTPVAPEGYNAPIRLLVGIRFDGQITGVRVLEHRETPGLGDDIDIQRSDWILAFDGTGLNNPLPDQWAIKQDGGSFDQLTGATVTPRAVVKAIKNTLIYFQEHRSELEQLATQATEAGE